MQSLIRHFRFLALATGTLTAIGCGGDSPASKSDSSTTTSTGGTGGTGGNGAGNTTSATSSATNGVGGSGATSTTTVGAGGGPATSEGGAGGTSGAAGATKGTDSGGTGGSGGAGGTAGSGGTGPTGVIGVLGEPCATPGELACAGNHQRVSLICVDGAWELNETCAENHACDTTPGFDQGACRERLPECVDQEPGHGVCEDSTTLLQCGPDNVTLEPVECEGSCYDGACDDRPNHCPAEPFINCGSECGELSASCGEAAGCEGKPLVVLLRFDEPGQRRVVRMGDFDALCSMTCETSATRGLRLFVSTSVTSSWRVTVPPPWRIGTSSGYCFEDATEGCRVFGPGNGEVPLGTVLTDDPAATEQNILIESAEEGEVLECP